jgi:hypothetical protein
MSQYFEPAWGGVKVTWTGEALILRCSSVSASFR